MLKVQRARRIEAMDDIASAMESTTEEPVAITVNDLLDVRLLDDAEPASYVSRVNDISSDKVVIAWPTNRGILMVLRKDQALELSFVRSGSAYALVGLVKETNSEPPPSVTLRLNGMPTRVQRRQHFRFKSFIPVEVVGSIVSDIGDSKGDSTRFLNIKTGTYDLSGSGLSIRHSEAVPEGTMLEAKIALPDKGPTIKVPCRVVRSEIVPGNFKRPLYHIGISYLALTESERTRIVRHVYRAEMMSMDH